MQKGIIQIFPLSKYIPIITDWREKNRLTI